MSSAATPTVHSLHCTQSVHILVSIRVCCKCPQKSSAGVTGWWMASWQWNIGLWLQLCLLQQMTAVSMIADDSCDYESWWQQWLWELMTAVTMTMTAVTMTVTAIIADDSSDYDYDSWWWLRGPVLGPATYLDPGWGNPWCGDKYLAKYAHSWGCLLPYLGNWHSWFKNIHEAVAIIIKRH